MTIRQTWRPISGFHGYEVSNTGRVRSFLRGVTPKTLKPHFSGSYWQVFLRRDKKSHPQTIGRLVLTAFTCAPIPGLQAAHNDGDVSNNHLDNLRWATAKDNNADKWRHGRMPIGEKSPAAKLSTRQAVAILNAHAAGVSSRRLSEKYGVAFSTIRRIINGVTWREALATAVLGDE